MNRKEYLDRLRIALHRLPMDEIEDILSDYEEHFDIGVSKGKSEEEISKELGDPREVANNYGGSNRASDNDDTKNMNHRNDNFSGSSRNMLLAIALIFFNLIIVIGPYFGLLGLLFGLYAASAGFIVGGIALFFAPTIKIFITVQAPHILTSLAFGIGLTALGALGILFAIYLTKHLYHLTIRYLRWNVELINRG